jgi:hypothetical protein
MSIKSEGRLWTGLALIGAAVLLVAVVLVSGALRRAELKAAAQAAEAAVQETAQKLAAERSSIEKKVLRAAALQPLNAALDDHVDGPTVVDLFENEDWWQPYRDDFSGARLILNDALFATWGQVEIGVQDRAVVEAARQQRVGSGQVTAGGQVYLLGAARLTALPDRAPVLVLVRRMGAVPAHPAAPTSGPPGVAGNPLLLLLAGVLGLAGAAAVVSSRRKISPASQAAVPVDPWAPIVEIEGIPIGEAHAAPTTGAPPRRTGSSSSFRPLEPSMTLPDAQPTPWAQGAGPASPGAPAPNPALSFGRYRVLNRLAEGGMSEIFTAESVGVEGFTRTFVLKRLRPELARDRDAVTNFIDEARTQASLVHSNIVPVFDFGVVEGEYFMTQEYIIGRDLTRLILRHHDQVGQRIDPRIAYFVAFETLQALAYAHSRCDNNGVALNIVHRDISPGNIIVSLQGEVKLSDFGIARANRRVTSTQVGLVKGNTDFMSPEQARGQAVDARSDLFSLGEVLYYCLTNEFLYGGDNDLDVLFKAAVGPTQEHRRRLRALPNPAGQILEKALALDAQDRFQSAAEFAEALAPHIGNGRTLTTDLMPRLFGKELRHQAA